MIQVGDDIDWVGGNCLTMAMMMMLRLFRLNDTFSIDAIRHITAIRHSTGQ